MTTLWRVLQACAAGYIVSFTALAQQTNDTPSPRSALVPIDNASIVGGTVLFRPGQLFIGREDLPNQPAVRLLTQPPQTSLPENSDAFDRLDQTCDVEQAQKHFRIHADLGGDGQLEEIRITRDQAHVPVQIKIYREQQLIAQSALPLPATPCFASVAEVDEDDRPELLVVWFSSESEHDVIGVHVFRLQED